MDLGDVVQAGRGCLPSKDLAPNQVVDLFYALMINVIKEQLSQVNFALEFIRSEVDIQLWSQEYVEQFWEVLVTVDYWISSLHSTGPSNDANVLTGIFRLAKRLFLLTKFYFIAFQDKYKYYSTEDGDYDQDYADQAFTFWLTIGIVHRCSPSIFSRSPLFFIKGSLQVKLYAEKLLPAHYQMMKDALGIDVATDFSTYFYNFLTNLF